METSVPRPRPCPSAPTRPVLVPMASARLRVDARAGARAVAVLLALHLGCCVGAAEASSLRFFGNGVGDIDRIKIRVDDETNALPGPPADIGTGDFTLEFWLRGSLGENEAPPISCGANIDWIYGNIVIDRDRYNQGRKWGLSLGAGVPVFGITGDGSGGGPETVTICASTNVLDGDWHHLAVQRRRSDGWLQLWVDGELEGVGDGPDGDVSYPDDGVPGDFCGGPCDWSDPFLVFGAEKHDAGSDYPSFSGWVDEIRLSDVLRYTSTFPVPAAPFVTDGATVALYHLDEGSGDVITDSSGHPEGPSPGIRRFGGNPAGPLWSAETPFTPTSVEEVGEGGAAPGDGAAGGGDGALGDGRSAGVRLRVAPNPASGAFVLGLERTGAAAQAESAVPVSTLHVQLHDAAGRIVWSDPAAPLGRVLTLPEGLPAGVYLLRSPRAGFAPAHFVVR